jgi:hypothetical protein
MDGKPVHFAGRNTCDCQPKRQQRLRLDASAKLVQLVDGQMQSVIWRLKSIQQVPQTWSTGRLESLESLVDVRGLASPEQHRCDPVPREDPR